MKIAPVLAGPCAARLRGEQKLVHTGQHYDAAMSDVFFADLGDAGPRTCSSGWAAAATRSKRRRCWWRWRSCSSSERPDLVIVAGDVNSTLAAALAAVKLGMPVAHVEAGLRSGDRTMPEEINRLLTDQISRFAVHPFAGRRRPSRARGNPAREAHPPGGERDDRHAARPSAEAARRSGVAEASGVDAAGVRGAHPAPPVERRRAEACSGSCCGAISELAA